MDSKRSCVNNGGLASVIRLPEVPVLEREFFLPQEALGALGIWQARVGEILTVVDAEGTAYRARITSLDSAKPSCVPFQRLNRAMESQLRIEVYQSLPDKERFEWVLQKLTELGADRMVPIESERSATLEERDSLQKKSHRWPEVISKAARQCRRAKLPELSAVLPFAEALTAAAACELKFILYEGDVCWSLMEGFKSIQPQSVALLIGPEGGFSSAEVQQAEAAGFLPVSLGPRILRTETAAVAATVLLQACLGDLA